MRLIKVLSMATALAALVVAGPSVASAETDDAIGIQSTQCWVSNVGRNADPQPIGPPKWPFDPTNAVLLHSCIYSDGVKMWAKSSLIGRANMAMYGYVQVSLQRCSDGARLTTGRTNWDGHNHIDRGTQSSGKTYFTNVWTAKVNRVAGMRVRLMMRIGGRVYSPAYPPLYWALASDGPDGVTPPNENWYAPSNSNPQPQKCVTL
ncbi:hypothetical protein [Amycolatopsis japonica]